MLIFFPDSIDFSTESDLFKNNLVYVITLPFLFFLSEEEIIGPDREVKY